MPELRMLSAVASGRVSGSLRSAQLSALAPFSRSAPRCGVPRQKTWVRASVQPGSVLVPAWAVSASACAAVSTSAIAWCAALRATSPPIEWPTSTISSTAHRPRVDEPLELHGELAPVGRDVAAGVVAEVDRGEAELVLERLAVDPAVVGEDVPRGGSHHAASVSHRPWTNTTSLAVGFGTAAASARGSESSGVPLALAAHPDHEAVLVALQPVAADPVQRPEHDRRHRSAVQLGLGLGGRRGARAGRRHGRAP